MRRLVIRRAIGDFIVSLPALECLRSDTSKSDRIVQRALIRFAGAVRSIASTGLDCWA